MTGSITCPRCGMTSYNRNDIEQRYCGHCHQFHEFMDADDGRTVAAMSRELTTKPPMELVCTPLTVLQLTGLLQLATRHPALSADNRAAAERFIAGARQYFADAPAVLEVIRRGDDPAEDR